MEHAFAGNPLVGDKTAAPSGLGSMVLPLYNGKPLVTSADDSWHLVWQTLDFLENVTAATGIEDLLVSLGERDGQVYFALDVSPWAGEREIRKPHSAFVDVRTLMTGTNWRDKRAMEELSIAGHARALLEWHKQVRCCGRCGDKTGPCDAGQRRKCRGCNSKYYPRTDPVVIMLVIDKERDCALFGRQSRFVPRMWSCLAGFIEPGESLEEAVRRETKEETNVDVGEVVYHSSQPWPVGTSSMPCQLMVGFFAIAKTFDIEVDKKELEEARWQTREETRNALLSTDYRNVQQASALKIKEKCMGEEEKRMRMEDEKGDVGDIFFPGPYAIAHHLIATWVNKGNDVLVSKM